MTALAIAVDTFLDVLAYIICIWRYKKSNSSKHTKENGNYKDQVASICLALLFIFSAFWVEVLSIKSFLAAEKPVRSYVFIFVAIFQVISTQKYLNLNIFFNKFSFFVSVIYFQYFINHQIFVGT